MYEELIKALKNCNYPACGYYCSQGCFMSQEGSTCELIPLLRKAADVIEELQKQRDEWESHAALAESFARGWIPVTERLPEKDTRVIVCASLPEGVHSDFIYEDGHWFVSTGVTHWMPFPEPPKEGEI